MKKYTVDYSLRNAGQISGEEPYSLYPTERVDQEIEAETAEQAVEYAIDYVAENLRQYGNFDNVETKEDEVVAFNEDGKAVEEYYNFTATEIEE
jgi:hypothetical protein